MNTQCTKITAVHLYKYVAKSFPSSNESKKVGIIDGFIFQRRNWND